MAKKKVDVNAIRADLTIDPFDINSEFMKQPGLFFHYARLLEDATDKLRGLKTKMSVFEAEQEARIRRKADQVGERATELYVKSQMRRKPGWKKLQVKIRKAEHAIGILYAARTAMSQKKDCLISLGANFRENPEFIIREKKTKKKRSKK